MKYECPKDGDFCAECGRVPERLAYLGESGKACICAKCADVVVDLSRYVAKELARRERIKLLADVLREFGNTDEEISEVTEGALEMLRLEDEE